MVKIGRVHTMEQGFNMEDIIWKRELKRAKVFVMDESALFGAMIKTNLESGLECTVLCFESGKELFDNMVFDYPDIIIIDFFQCQRVCNAQQCVAIEISGKFGWRGWFGERRQEDFAWQSSTDDVAQETQSQFDQLPSPLPPDCDGGRHRRRA